jgi:hypothetical protein
MWLQRLMFLLFLPYTFCDKSTSRSFSRKLPKYNNNNSIYLLTRYEGIVSLLSPRPWLLTEAKPRSIVRVEGTTNLLFPNTPVYKYFIIPKNIRLIVEWSPQNDKDLLNHVSFASILHYKSEYYIVDIFMLFPQSFIRVWFFWESRLQHKYTWWLQILWKFWNFLKF